MKIPAIATKHKIRDAKICTMWATELLSHKAIGKHFGISSTRVAKILYRNLEFLKYQKGWEKVRRIVWLKQQIKKAGRSEKDSADLQEQLKREIEGDKPLIDNSRHLHLSSIDPETLKGKDDKGLVDIVLGRANAGSINKTE